VGKAGILEIVPTDVMEGLRAIGGAHAVHLHDDKAEVGQRREPPLRTKGLGNERTLGTGIDLLDHRIFFGGIKTLGPADDAPDVSFSVASFGREYFRGFPV